MDKKKQQIFLGTLMLLVVTLILSGSFIQIIPAGHVGVVYSLFGGVEKRILKEGINIVIPFIESVTTYDARRIAYNFNETYDKYTIGQSIQCQTNDGQNVAFDVTVIAHLNKNEAWKLHQNLGKSYAERLIVPHTRSSFRNTVAKYPIEVVYTAGRKGLTEDAFHDLKKHLRKNSIILDEILIRGVRFSETFADAVERKQIALQESQRQKWMKRTAEKEKERKIIEGEGDATALSVKGQALSGDPRIAELEFLEQLENSDREFTVISGAKNSIINVGDFLKPEIKNPAKKD